MSRQSPDKTERFIRHLTETQDADKATSLL